MSDRPTAAISGPTYSIFDGLQKGNKRGLARFSSQLARHIDLCGWKRLLPAGPHLRSSFGGVLVSELVEPLWRTAMRPEVSIYPFNVAPLICPASQGLRVLVLHDLIFLEDLPGKGSGDRYREVKLARSLASADCILTVSQASRAAICDLGVAPERVSVLPNALPSLFEQASPQALPPAGPACRILHFGGLAPSKNTRALVHAVALVKAAGRPIHLLLAAMSREAHVARQWCQHAGLTADEVSILPYLDDQALVRLYGSAHLHCMPSTAEGFGIPVVEAARCGVANVLTPLPVFSELVGDHAFQAQDTSAPALASALLQAIYADRLPVIARARARTDRFLFERVHVTHARPALHAIEALCART